MITIGHAITTGPMPRLNPARDPIAFGIRAAELQRPVLQRLPFARARVSIVGAKFEHAAVDAGGVRVETLGGWRDKLNEKLDPATKFSTSGENVRPATRRDVLAWIVPRTPWALVRIAFLPLVAFAIVRLASLAPAALYVEMTYRDARTMTVETNAGAWETRTRIDLQRIITTPTLGSRAVGAADHAEAARRVLATLGSRCELSSSRDVFLGEFEHSFSCGQGR